MDCLTQLNIDQLNSGTCLGQNQWLKEKCDDVIDVFNPSDETLIAKVTPTSDLALDKVINHAMKNFQIWKAVPAPKRAELVRVIGEKLRKKKKYLGQLITLEMGKSIVEAEGEVQEMIDMADYAVGLARSFGGRTLYSERPFHRMYEQWHPLGVVGVISAFNFPAAVWSWNAFISAICGNTVVWKPSEKVPLSAIAIQHICNESSAELDMPNIFYLINLNTNELKSRFVDDERVSLISFTGSCQTGKQIGQRVAQRMGRSLLELGGNNAIILDESANLKLAIPAIVFGAIGTAGQRCTTTRRLFIHEKIFEQVKKHLIDAYRQIKIGPPLDKNNNMGPLIDHQAVIDYQKAIQLCLDEGGELLYGGQVLKDAGYYVEPTLIKAKNEWPIVQNETFAPILYLIPFNHLEHAIQFNNQVKQGLSSAIFTESLKNAERFLSACGSDCGIANVNIGTSGAEIGGAFGGEKETGGGREAGSDAWKAYMRRQTNTINWGDDLPLAQGIEFNIST